MKVYSSSEFDTLKLFEMYPTCEIIISLLESFAFK